MKCQPNYFDAQRPVRIPGGCRTGFTVIELLLVIAIIAILSTLGLAVMRGAEEDALVSRTQAQIERLSQALNRKVEEYAYRNLPFRIVGSPPGTAIDPKDKRFVRDAAIEELLRVEFPTRRNDLLDDPMGTVADPPILEPGEPLPPGPYLTPFPLNRAPLSAQFFPPYGSPGGSSNNGTRTPNPNPTVFDWSTFPTPQTLIRYRAKVGMPTTGVDFGPDWTREHEGAECLYLILSLITREDGQSGLTLVRKTDIKDTDGDGKPEIVDAFGDPLLVDLINTELINDDGSYVLPYEDPHIDPRFDPTPKTGLADPEPVYPTKVNDYRLIIRSINTAGKL